MPDRKTRIKVCGIRTRGSVNAVSDGVDYVGVNFWSKSRRFIAPSDAGRLAGGLPRHIRVVGLFVNPRRSEVDRVLDELAVDILQFHGDESPTFCQSFGIPYMKAIRLRDHSSVDAIADFLPSPDGYILVDTYVAGMVGGTGSPVRPGASFAEIRAVSASDQAPVTYLRKRATPRFQPLSEREWGALVTTGELASG